MPPVRKKKKSSPNSVPKAKAVGRKERRKREREAKKQRKASYNSRFSTRQLQDPVKEKRFRASSSIPSVPNPNVAKKRTVNHVSPVAENDRKEIQRLEKLLNVKKKDKLPKSFASDGLDCILKFIYYFSQFLSLPLYFPQVLLNDAKQILG